MFFNIGFMFVFLFCMFVFYFVYYVFLYRFVYFFPFVYSYLYPGGDEIFRPSRPTLGPTQPPVQWVLGLPRG